MTSLVRRFEIERFGLEGLRATEGPRPEPGPGEARVAWRAASLNYRDWLVVSGRYNPRLALPAVPLSDGAGVVTAIGPASESADASNESPGRLEVGQRVVSHFVSGWVDGPYRGQYLGTTLGTPGPGVAAEESVVPVTGLLPLPDAIDFASAATLPIAALTAWSSLVTEGPLDPARSPARPPARSPARPPADKPPAGKPPTVLLLGTGGVSIFGLQLGRKLGARIAITSSSEDKLDRARDLGAELGVNYRSHPEWDQCVLDWTDGEGVDLVLEAGGVGTLNASLRAVRPGGTIALFGALTGLEGSVNLAPVLMKRIRVAGILVDCRRAMNALLDFVAVNQIQPIIDQRFKFDDLPAALSYLQRGEHFGKIVLDFD